MASSPTLARKPVVRRFGRLVVRISEDWLEIRGYRKRRWLKLSWLDVAKLAAERSLPEKKRNWTEDEWYDVLKTIGARPR